MPKDMKVMMKLMPKGRRQAVAKPQKNRSAASKAKKKAVRTINGSSSNSVMKKTPGRKKAPSLTGQLLAAQRDGDINRVRRIKNNEACRRTRMKRKIERETKQQRINQLKLEILQMQQALSKLSKETMALQSASVCLRNSYDIHQHDLKEILHLQDFRALEAVVN